MPTQFVDVMPNTARHWLVCSARFKICGCGSDNSGCATDLLAVYKTVKAAQAASMRERSSRPVRCAHKLAALHALIVVSAQVTVRIEKPDVCTSLESAAADTCNASFDTQDAKAAERQPSLGSTPSLSRAPTLVKVNDQVARVERIIGAWLPDLHAAQ